jgi:hypothetical protein
MLRKETTSNELLQVLNQLMLFDVQHVITGLTNFTIADNMPDPICLKGKYWEFIRKEMVEIVHAH